MTQEEKSLLLQGLCARLPYGVICHANEINIDGELIFVNKLYNIAAHYYDSTIGIFEYCPINDIKPYLRPMSSMTGEEKKNWLGSIHHYNFEGQPCLTYIESYDWLNKNMFDYRRLIPMGIALVAPEGMYNIKEK